MSKPTSNALLDALERQCGQPLAPALRVPEPLAIAIMSRWVRGATGAPQGPALTWPSCLVEICSRRACLPSRLRPHTACALTHGETPHRALVVNIQPAAQRA